MLQAKDNLFGCKNFPHSKTLSIDANVAGTPRNILASHTGYFFVLIIPLQVQVALY